jgi:hypothetical protein
MCRLNGRDMAGRPENNKQYQFDRAALSLTRRGPGAQASGSGVALGISLEMFGDAVPRHTSWLLRAAPGDD